ncbi:YadA-like family protein [Luteimonas viscosa]|nr:YadA-like family protein [Luteimonas viscosa]
MGLCLMLAALQMPAVAGSICLNNGAGSLGSAEGLGAFACGSSSASGLGSIAFGTSNISSGWASSAVGYGNTAGGNTSNAFGYGNTASGENSSAFGYQSQALNTASTAIGYQAIADRDYSVAVGSSGNERQIIHLADGTEATDAVNLRQMRAADDDLGAGIAAWLGGGATHAGGVFTAPVYVIQSNNYDNVGSAFGAVDAALTDINQRIVDAGGIQGERGDSAYEVAVRNGFAGTEADWLGSLQGPVGPGGPQGPEGPAGGGPRSVVYDDDNRDVLTLAGDEGTIIANVADGVAATDAANVRQVQAGDSATLASANAHTDTVAVQTLQSANEYTDSRFAAWDAQLDSIQRGIDDRFHEQDRRIDRQGAMAGAFAGMAMNTAGLAGRNRVGVGVGAQGGEQALAVGYQRALGTRASVSFGGAFSGGEKSVMGGAGFSW